MVKQRHLQKSLRLNMEIRPTPAYMPSKVTDNSAEALLNTAWMVRRGCFDVTFDAHEASIDVLGSVRPRIAWHLRPRVSLSYLANVWSMFQPTAFSSLQSSILES